jgi:hypothetical protein
MEIRDYLIEKYDVTMITNCYILSFVTKNIKNILNNFDFKEIDAEIIHISNNNMTLNIVLQKFNPNLVDKIYKL